MSLYTQTRRGIVKGEPRSFIYNHHKWGTRPNCHPDRKHRAKGLCQQCYEGHIYRSRKYGKTRSMGEWLDWERQRYDRFLVLTRAGVKPPAAIRVLDEEVPAGRSE